MTAGMTMSVTRIVKGDALVDAVAHVEECTRASALGMLEAGEGRGRRTSYTLK